MRGHWPRSDQGFISAYFLVLLMLILTVIAAQAINLANRLKCAENIIVINRYLAAENAVLAEVKCTLKECIRDEAEIPYDHDERTIYINIDDPAEFLEIDYDAETGTVYDYTVFRDET